MKMNIIVAGVLLAVSAAAESMNVIFILADDLGWSDTTLYGHTDFYETPNLERVAYLDRLLQRHLDDANAVLPNPNPAFDPAQYHPEFIGLTPEEQADGGTRSEAENQKANVVDRSRPTIIGNIQ